MRHDVQVWLLYRRLHQLPKGTALSNSLHSSFSFSKSQVKNAKAGKMKYVIGSGRNKMDWTYAGNVAQVG